jgi:hypothetical protein
MRFPRHGPSLIQTVQWQIIHGEIAVGGPTAGIESQDLLGRREGALAIAQEIEDVS